MTLELFAQVMAPIGCVSGYKALQSIIEAGLVRLHLLCVLCPRKQGAQDLQSTEHMGGGGVNRKERASHLSVGFEPLRPMCEEGSM